LTPYQLALIGRRLYGKRWQTPLGRAIGKHRITIWRYFTKATPIPEEDAEKVRALDPGPQKRKTKR
jgi:hypothetical protein